MNIKKILLGCVIVIVVGAGGIAWMARQQFTKNLALFSTPQTVRFGTVDVALPALHGNVTGVFEPRAELGDVAVTLQIAGYTAPVTLQLTNAIVSARPFALDLSLMSESATVTAALLPAAQVLNRVVLTVRPPSTLTRFAIGETAFTLPGEAPADGQPAKTATLTNFELALVPTPSYVPEELRVRLGGLDVAKSATETVVFKGLDFAFLSKPGTDRRATTNTLAWQEISLKSESANFLIKPFTYEMRGSIKERAADDVAAKALAFKDAVMGFSTTPGDVNMHAALRAFFEFLLFFEPGSDTSTVEWQGFTLEASKGQTAAAMLPCRMSMRVHEHPYTVNYDSGCESLRVTLPSGETVVKQITLKGDAKYPFQTMMEALQAYQGFDVETPSLDTVLQMMIGYPTHMAAAIGVQDVEWKHGSNAGQLHNVGYDLNLDDQGFGLTLHGDVAQLTVPAAWQWPITELTNASLRSHYGILVPWNELQTRLRTLLQAPKFEVVALVKQALVDWGINFSFDLKGGNLGFDSSAAATFNTKLDQWELPSAIAHAFANVTSVDDPALAAAFEKLSAAVTPHILAKGALDITIDVRKLTGLKALINTITPGAADMALAGAKAFLVVDDTKDTLSGHLQIHDGHVEVNGAPQPMLDAMFQELRASGDPSTHAASRHADDDADWEESQADGE